MFAGVLPPKLPPLGLISMHIEGFTVLSSHVLPHFPLMLLAARNSLLPIGLAEHVSPTDRHLGEGSTPTVHHASNDLPPEKRTIFDCYIGSILYHGADNLALRLMQWRKGVLLVWGRPETGQICDVAVAPLMQFC